MEEARPSTTTTSTILDPKDYKDPLVSEPDSQLPGTVASILTQGMEVVTQVLQVATQVLEGVTQVLIPVLIQVHTLEHTQVDIQVPMVVDTPLLPMVELVPMVQLVLTEDMEPALTVIQIF